MTCVHRIDFCIVLHRKSSSSADTYLFDLLPFQYKYSYKGLEVVGKGLVLRYIEFTFSVIFIQYLHSTQLNTLLEERRSTISVGF